jgi:hypothetical protein
MEKGKGGGEKGKREKGEGKRGKRRGGVPSAFSLFPSLNFRRTGVDVSL